MSEHEHEHEPGEICSATARHPELDVIGCELPAGHEGPHQFDPNDGQDGVIQWDDDDARPAFDLDAFVKSLPPHMCLCPMCIGIGAVVEDPPFDPTTHVCPTCRGGGVVRTGSLKSDKAERQCPTCGGDGFVPNDPSAPRTHPARADDVQHELPARDHEGRTPDDPEFDWTRIVEREPAPAGVVEVTA